ncbi:hypothetical protein AB0F11_30475 [Streptomyces sp. NPDC032472]|uniref:hypothetical protein n=1 Tax=Streptomyces sp. NPDC032472 TaxID=3155018 RepID=UPI00340CECB9
MGPDGKIVVRNGSWQPTDVVIDVNGYYTPDSSAAYTLYRASRLFDTRESGHPLAARDIYRQSFDLDLQHVEALILNTTVTNTTGAGFLSVTSESGKPEQAGNGSPIPPARPISSVLNWTAGKTVANFAQVRPGKAISYWNQGWENIDLIVDYNGSYSTD